MIDDDYIKENLVRWITFQLAHECYAVPVEHVREILRVNNVFPVPGSPDCVIGITNIRGNVVTIIDGRKRFSLPDHTYDDSARIIVVEAGDEVAGIVVDEVSDVIDLPESAVNINPKINAREDSKYIRGVVTQKDALIIMLNVDKIFTDETYENAAGF